MLSLMSMSLVQRKDSMSISCCHCSDQYELIGVGCVEVARAVASAYLAQCTVSLLTASEVGGRVATVATVASVAVSVASVAITLASPRLRYTFSQHARRCCTI